MQAILLVNWGKGRRDDAQATVYDKYLDVARN